MNSMGLYRIFETKICQSYKSMAINCNISDFWCGKTRLQTDSFLKMIPIHYPPSPRVIFYEILVGKKFHGLTNTTK